MQPLGHPRTVPTGSQRSDFSFMLPAGRSPSCSESLTALHKAARQQFLPVLCRIARVFIYHDCDVSIIRRYHSRAHLCSTTVISPDDDSDAHDNGDTPPAAVGSESVEQDRAFKSGSSSSDEGMSEDDSSGSFASQPASKRVLRCRQHFWDLVTTVIAEYSCRENFSRAPTHTADVPAQQA